MRGYIIRRLLILIPTLLLVTVILFFVTASLPGTMVDAVMASMGVDVEIDREELVHTLGLDVPLLTQYGRWKKGEQHAKPTKQRRTIVGYHHGDGKDWQYRQGWYLPADADRYRSPGA